MTTGYVIIYLLISPSSISSDPGLDNRLNNDLTSRRPWSDGRDNYTQNIGTFPPFIEYNFTIQSFHHNITIQIL